MGFFLVFWDFIYIGGYRVLICWWYWCVVLVGRFLCSRSWIILNSCVIINFFRVFGLIFILGWNFFSFIIVVLGFSFCFWFLLIGFLWFFSLFFICLGIGGIFCYWFYWYFFLLIGISVIVLLISGGRFFIWFLYSCIIVVVLYVVIFFILRFWDRWYWIIRFVW